MRYKADQKINTRRKIVDAAGRSFRKNGFSGIGVDGLAKEAGVTSGAFYKHFPSKKAAFESAVTEGLKEVKDAISSLEETHGENWWAAFADIYLSEKRTCDASQSCGLQSLTSEVARGDDSVRNLYQSQLLTLASAASGHEDGLVKDETWQKLAMLVGGVSLARAVKDPALSENIAAALKASELFK